MEKQLSKKELQAIRHIRNSLVRNGSSPSVRQLMKALGYKSPRSAQDILEKLEKKNVIKKTKYGNYQLIKDPESKLSHAQTLDVPLVGTISCGIPLLAEENIKGNILVATSMLKSGLKHFILRASGDSMNLTGINDGDLVLVRQQSTAQNGDRVVALIDDEATIKEFNHVGNAIVLKPKSSNPRNKPIILTNNFKVQGVVVSVIPVNKL